MVYVMELFLMPRIEFLIVMARKCRNRMCRSVSSHLERGKTGPVLLYGYRRHFLGQLWLYAGRSAGSGRIFKRAGHVWN